jgi:hypothetical protein
MARGSKVLLAAQPKGVFLEGIISGTPYPGTLITVSPGVAIIEGRHTWIAGWSGSNADPRLTCIILEDDFQGFVGWNPVTGVIGPAYVTGTRFRAYCPLPGEEMNICVAGQPGTGSTNAFTIGERLIFQASNGQAIVEATSSVKANFMCMEHIDEVADQPTLVWCMMQ